MEIGIFSFNTEHGLPIARLAAEVEARGFESLWVPEHTHIPVPAPGEPAHPETGMPATVTNDFLGEEYRHMSCPFTSLSAAAAVTSRIRLGTCICLINQHHVINLAKQVATLDQISGGRVTLGIGAGWNKAEMGHHGISFENRWKQLLERLAAVRKLWMEEVASFDGEFVSFGESWMYPKPLQRAGPPVLFGTMDTPFGREVVARHADGWLPLTFNVQRIAQSLEDVQRRMKEHGRDPQDLDVSLFFLADQLQPHSVVDAARELNINRIILRLPATDESDVLCTLDRYGDYLSSS